MSVNLIQLYVQTMLPKYFNESRNFELAINVTD